MTTQNTINLIRTKTTNSSQFDAIEASLRRSGFIFLIIVLCLGLLLGLLYILFSSEEKNLLTQKNRYVTQVSNDKDAEGYFRSIKDRTRIVTMAMTSKKPWSKLLDEVSAFVKPPNLSRIEVDGANMIILTVNADSVDDILPIANAIMAKAQANNFINPLLSSFQITKTGNVLATFSFSAVF